MRFYNVAIFKIGRNKNMLQVKMLFILFNVTYSSHKISSIYFIRKIPIDGQRQECSLSNAYKLKKLTSSCREFFTYISTLHTGHITLACFMSLKTFRCMFMDRNNRNNVVSTVTVYTGRSTFSFLLITSVILKMLFT